MWALCSDVEAPCLPSVKRKEVATLSIRSKFIEIETLSSSFAKVLKRQQEAGSQRVLDHPGAFLVLKGLEKLSLRELAVLVFITNEVGGLRLDDLEMSFPDEIRVEAVLALEARVSRLCSRDKLSHEEYHLKLVHFVDNNPAFFASRGLDIIVKTLRNCRVYWQLPKPPKKGERQRGYRDHGSRASNDVRARRKANEWAAWESEVDKQKIHEEAVIADLRVATAILDAEARGISTEDIQARSTSYPELKTMEEIGEELPEGVKLITASAEDDIQSLQTRQGHLKRMTLS